MVVLLFCNTWIFLYDDGLITKFLDDNTYDEIIKKSVFYHNKTSIDPGIKGRELVFCKLIREKLSCLSN